MEHVARSETLPYTIQKPGNHPQPNHSIQITAAVGNYEKFNVIPIGRFVVDRRAATADTLFSDFSGFILSQCVWIFFPFLQMFLFQCVNINPLTPELNHSEQRCLPKYFTADFASLTVHFVNSYMREKPTNSPIIHSVY
jgi:hypothetical protein